MKIKLIIIASALLALNAGCSNANRDTSKQTEWVSLFDGESLDGWTVVNGEAPYEVIDGVIRGTNVVDTPNSFLATDETYADFVLEYEARSEGIVNSGVQFRTKLAPESWSGVAGYQVDIDPTPRAWTGGIYHEGINVWRHSMARNQDCRTAYRHGEWNRYRVEAIGNTMATWLNDVPCAHMVGDHHDTGFIALQVHTLGSYVEYAGSYTEWRNIRIKASPVEADVWQPRRGQQVEGWLIDEVSDVEKQLGWSALQTANLNTGFVIPENTFEFVVDIQMSPSAEGLLEYALPHDGAHCTGAFKILDDMNFPEGHSETDKMGSVPGLLAASNLSEAGRPKRLHGNTMWNRLRLIVTENQVAHWLNGVKVVEYSRCNEALTSSATDVGAQPTASIIELTTYAGEIDYRSAKFLTLSK